MRLVSIFSLLECRETDPTTIERVEVAAGKGLNPQPGEPGTCHIRCHRMSSPV